MIIEDRKQKVLVDLLEAQEISLGNKMSSVKFGVGCGNRPDVESYIEALEALSEEAMGCIAAIVEWENLPE